jgi:hypothetical protein
MQARRQAFALASSVRISLTSVNSETAFHSPRALAARQRKHVVSVKPTAFAAAIERPAR